MDGQYVRSASLFANVADRLHDLQLFDSAMAEAAPRAGIPVADLDTSPGEVPARLLSPE